MILTRKAHVKVIYKSKILSKDITNTIKSFQYSEKIHGKADDISLTFVNKNNEFIKQNFLPDRGDSIQPTLVFENWYNEKEYYEIELGEFQVDEVEFEKTKSTEDIHIKAVPTIVNANVSGQNKTRSWENASLKVIAEDIAKSQGVELVFQATDILFNRVDQKKQSDLSFLTDLANKHGCLLKVADKKIILFESLKVEEKKVLSLHLGNISSYRIRSQSQDVYRGVILRYHDPLKDDAITCQYFPEDAPKVGKVLEINERVESYAQAEKIAKARLREKNAKQIEISMNLFPNPFIRAGLRVEFDDFPYVGKSFLVQELQYGFERENLTQSIKLQQCLGY